MTADLESSPHGPSPGDDAGTASYALSIAYDGTEFHGWQKQEPPDPDAPPGADGTRARLQLRTVQHVVEQAARRVCRDSGIQLRGASRTDSGVHAGLVLADPASLGLSGPTHPAFGDGGLPAGTNPGQCAAFTTTIDRARGVGWPVDRGAGVLVRALNAELPRDVLCTGARVVTPRFDPIAHAVSKCYTYTLATGPQRPLWDRRFVFHTWYELDQDRMAEAAGHLVGEHDFAAFAQINHGRRTTVRTIHRCRVFRPQRVVGLPSAADLGDGRLIGIEVAGSGFLYNMVRIIAGTLMEVGRGKIEPADIPAILASGDRRRAGGTLPPTGLRLEWIRYGVERSGEPAPDP